MGQEDFLTFLWKSVVILILTISQLRETCSSLEATGFSEALPVCVAGILCRLILERGQAGGLANWATTTTQVIKANTLNKQTNSKL